MVGLTGRAIADERTGSPKPCRLATHVNVGKTNRRLIPDIEQLHQKSRPTPQFSSPQRTHFCVDRTTRPFPAFGAAANLQSRRSHRNISFVLTTHPPSPAAPAFPMLMLNRERKPAIPMPRTPKIKLDGTNPIRRRTPRNQRCSFMASFRYNQEPARCLRLLSSLRAECTYRNFASGVFPRALEERYRVALQAKIRARPGNGSRKPCTSAAALPARSNRTFACKPESPLCLPMPVK